MLEGHPLAANSLAAMTAAMKHDKGVTADWSTNRQITAVRFDVTGENKQQFSGKLPRRATIDAVDVDEVTG